MNFIAAWEKDSGVNEMPIYEYKCQDCGYRFALLESLDAAQTGRECPKCGGRDTRRVLSSFAKTQISGGNADKCKPGG